MKNFINLWRRRMDAFLGFITPFPWTWAPQGWSLCQGQLIQIQQNTALYALLGTSFGGDGHTTFGLPDLRGRQIIGYGLNPATGINVPFAEKGGAQAVTLNAAQLPSHTHAATFAAGSGGVSVSTAAPSAATPLLTNGQTAYLANSSAGTSGNALKGLYTTTAPAAGATATVPVNAGGAVTVSPSGGSAPVSVMNPYLALNFCICLEGLFPSRN